MRVLPAMAALFLFLIMMLNKKLKQLLAAGAFIFALCSPALAQDMSRVKANLDSLCSPRMHGRGYVNYGDRHAAAFISKEFKKPGLQQFNDTYFQFFTLDVNTFPDRVALQVNGKLLDTGEELIADAASKGGEGRAKVVYLDSATIAGPEVTKIISKGFRKKAIVFDSPKTRKSAFQSLQFFSVLPSAAAVITLQKKLTASLAKEQLPFVSLEVLQSAWPAKAKKVRFAVDAEMQKNLISQNVAGLIPGTTEPDSVIIICAHYDHLGRMGRDDYFPGANDNASGISMLLELANFYASAPNKPHYSMLFIA
ncbi:MAG: M28 family peptidase, partial [Chitinophagaceae bacterium]